ncbi:probable disease resistance protein At1g12290 isoform X2 [Euphorbia lathyris]|uniref:probable disease resistance protein At1g12290 isoform X2 n=1 Tax=Euphorbia lathyris TaxID=212925 RepID=UPI0033137086
MLVVGLESLMNQAWDLLMDERTRSIAICGRGGIGKTTFMRQLYNKLLGTQDCESLIWVTVSSNSTPVKIQDDISKIIGIFDAKWVRSSFVEKARLIDCELSEKKFVLFLDDVWRRIHLLELGIPRNKVGDDDIFGDPAISELPEILVRRCRGLPILLCTVGRAMASRKTSREWLDALLKIRRLEGTDTQINSLLQFCFDSLPNHRIKCCLVYFSLFPEDFTIAKNELIDFWICEHLLDEYDTQDDTLDLGYNAIHTLIGAGLLEEEDDDYCVKLLDTIREFASSIAIKCQMFKRAQLIEATPENLVTHVGWPSTMGNFKQNLANTSSDLFAFLLNHNPFTMLKLQLFHRVEMEIEIAQYKNNVLTVLDLSYSGVEEVPREISTLVSLQYLNLSHTWIDRLPIELTMLTKLKCLNLEYDDQLRVIPRQLMYSLSSLHVLKMFRCGYSVEELGDNILSVRDMDIDPLLRMQHLKVLSITVTCASALRKIVSNPRLLSCIQSLSLEVFWDSKSLDISPLFAMKNLLTLEIRQTEVLEELNGNPLHSGAASFRRLRKITLAQCSNLQELTWVTLVPNLKVLRVESCEKMEEIITNSEGGEDVEPFAELEILALENLPKLKSIYWKALPFQHLKKIEIIDCSLLKKLPLNLDCAESNKLVIEAEEDWWKDVEWKDEATRIAFVPCFRQSLLV